MTPSDLRVLAQHAETTSQALTAKERECETEGAISVAIAYAHNAEAFMTFARVLAEAANTQEPHA